MTRSQPAACQDDAGLLVLADDDATTAMHRPPALLSPS